MPPPNNTQSFDVVASWVPKLGQMYAGAGLPYLALVATHGDCTPSVSQKDREGVAGRHDVYR